MKKDNWNRCDNCGKFIGFADFEKELAVRILDKPDSYCFSESYITLCKKCNKNYEGKMK